MTLLLSAAIRRWPPWPGSCPALVILTLAVFLACWHPQAANSGKAVGLAIRAHRLHGYSLGPLLSSVLSLKGGSQVVMLALGSTGRHLPGPVGLGTRAAA